MQTILITSIPEERQLAILEDEKLVLWKVERPLMASLVGNIYKGKIKNIIKSMQVAFIDIGLGKNAFLHYGNLHQYQDYFHPVEGQSVMVQIVKDEWQKKGAKASLNIALAGRMVVFRPYGEEINVSRRIEDESERIRLKNIVTDICPKKTGLILRTAAKDAKKQELAKDIYYLEHWWKKLAEKYKVEKAPVCLHNEEDLLIQLVRDILTKNVEKIVVDDKETLQRLKKILAYAVPYMNINLQFYQGDMSLFTFFQVDKEIQKLSSNKVELASGGFLIIDKTEALTVIDVNTGKFTGAKNGNNIFYDLNIEAASEILRQIRLRDIGGIIIVDFIDMEREEQKANLLAFLQMEAKKDPIKTNILGMTRLGLVEMTRKKAHKSATNLYYDNCPYCAGRGTITSCVTVAMSIIRSIREREKIFHAPFGYIVEVHPQVAEAIHFKNIFGELKKEKNVTLEIVARETMNMRAFSIMRKEDL